MTVLPFRATVEIEVAPSAAAGDVDPGRLGVIAATRAGDVGVGPASAGAAGVGPLGPVSAGAVGVGPLGLVSAGAVGVGPLGLVSAGGVGPRGARGGVGGRRRGRAGRGGVGGGVGDVVPAAHCELLRTLLSRVTAPLRASVRPITDAPLFTEMLVSASTLPWNAVVVPMVAELPTCQKTLHGEAPLISTTELSDAVVSVEPIMKTNCALGSPCASRVTVP